MKTTKLDKDVHTEHCCVIHGCKYGDGDCPVAAGIKKQSFLCERCHECGLTELGQLKKYTNNTLPHCPHCGYIL